MLCGFMSLISLLVRINKSLSSANGRDSEFGVVSNLLQVTFFILILGKGGKITSSPPTLPSTLWYFLAIRLAKDKFMKFGRVVVRCLLFPKIKRLILMWYYFNI